MKNRFFQSQINRKDDRILCFHHNDADGICSGRIVRMKYPSCQLIPLGYADPFPWHYFSVPEKRRKRKIINLLPMVFMVDFSLPPKEMKILSWLGNPLIWIDHHKIAINEFCQDYRWYFSEGLVPICRFAIGKAACQLTWEYIFPGTQMPEVVKRIGDRDVGK